MASQGVAANSRLAEMQMKFQKKQMVEREQKKLALAHGEFSQAPKSTIGNGRVRQMFDDRRRGVGIDRSHPLRPLVTSNTSTIRTKTHQPAANKPSDAGANIRHGLHNNYSVPNGNLNVFQNNFDEVDNIDSETFPREFSSLSLSNSINVMGSYVTDAADFENNNNEKANILSRTVIINKRVSPKTNSIKLNPVITKKSPTTTMTKTTNRNPSSDSRTSTLSKSTTSSVKSPPPKLAATSTINKNMKTIGNKTNNTKPATFIMSVKPPPRYTTPPPGMASCQHCQRHFNEERLDKHEEVCRKMMTKKRKIFDASKHRVQGTEAEKYLKKGKSLSSTTTKSVAASTITSQTPKNSVEKKSDWRKKHEEFIAAIREAKKVQAYLAKGGKLRDLPPPPPSENPDYIQCPHCSRRFNEAAAERHIPKCANMQHNKTKPIRKRF